MSHIPRSKLRRQLFGCSRLAFAHEERGFAVVSAETGSRFSTGDPRLLFEFERDVLELTAPVRNDDVASDGRRFVFVRSTESTTPPVREIQLVLNWDRELERLAP